VEIIHATEKEVADVERIYRPWRHDRRRRYRKVIELWQKGI